MTPAQQACDLLHQAFETLNEVHLSDRRELHGIELRHEFMRMMRLLAVWVANGDDEMSAEENTAISDIFWLDGPKPDNALIREGTTDPANVEDAERFLLTAVADVRDHDVAKPGTVPSDGNIICEAADLVFQTVAAADEIVEAELARLTELSDMLWKAAQVARHISSK